MEILERRIEGVSPLIMHNGRLADPSYFFTKEIKKISSKRKKVDADFEEMARLEFLGSLYTQDGVIILPGIMLEGALIGKGGAARKERMGVQAAPALFVPDDFPLIYDGPQDPDDLWEDKRFVHTSLVRVQSSKVVRTRPVFNKWAADVTIMVNDELLDLEIVDRWLVTAGEIVGLGDWRPRHGRFKVVEK